MPTPASIDAATADALDALDAHAILLNHTLSYIKSMCLKCVVELRIPDAIHHHGIPATISDLISSLSILEAKSRRLRIMMRLLSLEGIFKSHVTLSGEEAFDLTPVSRLLTTVTPLRPSSSPIVVMLLDHHFLDPCQQLSRWFHRPDVAISPFEMTYGKPFWNLKEVQPEFDDLFDNGMASDSVFFMDILKHIGGEVFQGIGSLVDVGGGTGKTAAALVKAFPGMKCIVFDLPHVVNKAEKMDGIQFVGGDMFADIPPANVALLKWILHDWSDEDCIKILKRCKEAIPTKENGGKVIIVDIVVGVGINTETTLETQLLFDLLMMTHHTGKERDVDEWHKLFIAAGLSNYKITSSTGLRSIIEVYP